MPRTKMNPMAKLAKRCADLADMEAELEAKQTECEVERKKLQIELATLLAVHFEEQIDNNSEIMVQARRDMCMQIDFTKWVNGDEPLEDAVRFFYMPVEQW